MGIAVAMLFVPLAALAADSASVTTDPGNAVPTMTLPLLTLLAAVLIGVATYQLRRPTAGRIVAFTVAVTLVGVGLGHAFLPAVEVDGANCGKQVTQSYNPALKSPILLNDCPNPIHIVAFEINCIDPPAPMEPCMLGQSLPPGGTCILPHCLF